MSGPGREELIIKMFTCYLSEQSFQVQLELPTVSKAKGKVGLLEILQEYCSLKWTWGRLEFQQSGKKGRRKGTQSEGTSPEQRKSLKHGGVFQDKMSA